MDRHALSLLSPELQETVIEAEARAGCEIAVRQDASASEFDNLTLSLDGLTGKCEAKIAHQDATISRLVLVHEVLHIKHLWVDRAPFLSPASERVRADAEMLNGLMAHLEIIPAERAYFGIESDRHWDAQMERVIGSLPSIEGWCSEADRYAFFRGAFLARAMFDIALPHLKSDALNVRLDAAGLLDSSATFVAEIQDRLADRASTIRHVAMVFGYAPSDFYLKKFDLDALPRRTVAVL